MMSSLAGRWHDLRFAQLFVFILFTMLINAGFHHMKLVPLVMSLLFLNALLVALSTAGSPMRLRWLMVILWAAGAAMRLWPLDDWGLECHVLGKSIAAAMLGLCAAAIVRHALKQRQVTADTLFAAVVGYILIALLFAQIYSIAEVLLPGSFAYPEGVVMPMDYHHSYFSFVTIATLGYGDIAPRHPLTQVLASIEAVIGQFYVAVLVAWLVSAYANQHPDGPDHS